MSQVVGHCFVPEVALGDEQVAVGGQVDEHIGPRGVPV
jgi:hypothetical protein